MAIVRAVLKIVDYLVWYYHTHLGLMTCYVIENPATGTLPDTGIFGRVPFAWETTYCRYGSRIRKPTYFATNIPHVDSFPPCSIDSPCDLMLNTPSDMVQSCHLPCKEITSEALYEIPPGIVARFIDAAETAVFGLIQNVCSVALDLNPNQNVS